MEPIGKWNGTSFELDNVSVNFQLINLLKGKKIGEEESEKYIIYNDANLFFFESEFICQESLFSNIMDKFYIKNYSGTLFYYHEGGFEELAGNPDEIETYSKIIQENNISGIDRSKLKISVNALEKILISNKDRFVETIYILIFLANKTKRDGNNFIFEFEDGEKIFLRSISFENSEDVNLFQLYDWIVNDTEFPNSYKTKLAIIRKIVFNKKSFEDSDDILIEAKSAFNRIISRETDKYFEQVNQLKEDFLSLADTQNKVNRSLHISVFGWLGYLAWTIFDVIRDYPGNNLFHKIINSQSEKVTIVLLILLSALMVIFGAYIKEIYDNKKTYLDLKDMYKNKLFFDEEDFIRYMKAPKISNLYLTGFIILAVVLVIRIIGFSKVFEFFATYNPGKFVTNAGKPLSILYFCPFLHKYHN